MPKEIFDVHIDMNRNELQNFVVQPLTVAPSTTGLPEGAPYWSKIDKTMYIWTGSAWLDLGQVYTHPTYVGTGQPATALVGANVISRITLENGHVTGVTTRALTPADIGAATTAHTHAYSQITNLPSMTVLGNNSGTAGNAQALTVPDLLILMGIAYGDATALATGTSTAQMTWSPKQLTDWVNVKLGGYITKVNLGYTPSPTNGTVTNTAGTSAVIPAGSTTNASLMLPTDKLKLDNVENGANNYQHPTLNPGAHPFATEITAGVQVLSQLVVNTLGHVITVKGRNLTAGDLAAIIINNASNSASNQTWSASKIYTEIQNAINQAQTGALQYQGEYNPATNSPNIGADGNIKTGYTYVSSADGTFAGQALEVGDMLIAKVDAPGTTASNWQIVNKNIPALVDASTTAKGLIMLATTAEGIAGTDNTKAITPAVLKAVLDSRVSGASVIFGDGSTTLFTINHPLNTQNLTIQVQRLSDRQIINCERKAPTTSSVYLGFNTPPANNAYIVILKP